MTQERSGRVANGVAQGCHACMEASATGDLSWRGITHTCHPVAPVLPWVRGVPPVDVVAEHEVAHPLPGRVSRGAAGAVWLVHEEAPLARPCLVVLTVGAAGLVLTATPPVKLAEATVLIANGLAFWQPLPDCRWAAAARYLPCTAEGVPACLVSSRP